MFDVKGTNPRTTHAPHSYLLSRRHFLVVFLGGADVGRVEGALQRQSRVSMENCAAGQDWPADFARARGMVLPAQRHDHAFAVHVEQ